MQIGKFVFVIALVTSLAHSDEPAKVKSMPLGLPDFYRFKGFSYDLAILGEKLFSSKELSRNNNVSCENCHLNQISSADLRRLSIGTHGGKTARNSPVIFNLYSRNSFMFDGRASTLIDQVALPLEDKVEMDVLPELAIQRLGNSSDITLLLSCLGYQNLDYGLIKKSLASYVGSLVSGDSRFDRYLYENEPDSLTKSEIRGFEIFRGKANCTSCHTVDTTSALFTDNGFHNLGVGYDGESHVDVGRYQVSEAIEDMGKFKTPTLRNISRTAPYMHDGSIESLIEVVEFYNEGGRLNPNLDRKIKPLNLTNQEMADLVDFLNSLDSVINIYSPSSNKCVN